MHTVRRLSLAALALGVLSVTGCEMRATQGTDQTGPVSTPLPEPLVVQIMNTDTNEPAAGVTVEFLVVEGGGSTTPQVTETDADGFARTEWTLGPEPGHNEVQVRMRSKRRVLMGGPGRVSGEGTEVTFTATALPKVPTYVDDVRPLLESSGCFFCHAAGTPRDFTTYAGLRQRVVPFQPDQSRLIAMAGPGGAMYGNWGGSDEEKRAKVEVLRQWILGGAPKPVGPPPSLTEVPGDRQGAPGARLTVRVSAVDRDGDAYPDLPLTWRVLEGDAQLLEGRRTTDHQGRAQVEVRLGPTEGPLELEASAPGAEPLVVALTVSDAFDPGALEGSTNPLDVAALTVLERRGVSPPDLAGDGAFLRRVTADLAGRLPTPSEMDGFLNDGDPQRRQRAIERLLGSSDFERQWATNVLGVWLQLPGDLPGKDRDGNAARWDVDAALQQALAQDQPLDRLVRGVIEREGVLGEAFDWHHREYYRQAQAEVLMTSFAGQSSRCARCHDHKFDTRYWTQGRAARLGAFFYEGSRGFDPSFDTDPAEVVFRRDGAQETDFSGAALFEASQTVSVSASEPEAERRRVFAEAFTGSPLFARGLGLSIAAELLWRVLPREHLTTEVLTTPSPELVKALGQLVRDEQSSLRGILRTLAGSRLYQLDSGDDVGFALAADAPDSSFRRHHGEVLEQGVHAALGLPLPGRSDRVFDAMLGRPLRQLEGTTLRASEIGLAVALVQLNYVGTPNPGDDLHGSAPGLVASSPLVDEQVGKVALGGTFADAAQALVRSMLGREAAPAELAAMTRAWEEASVRHPQDRRAAAEEALQDVAAALAATAEFTVH